jgi:chaperone modulatory protein CbpM
MMMMSKQEFLATSGLPAQTLVLWIEQRWLIPDETAAGMSFSERDVARARLIHDLQNDLGVNDEGIDVVLHLMDQLHGLRAALAHLRGRSD